MVDEGWLWTQVSEPNHQLPLRLRRDRQISDFRTFLITIETNSMAEGDVDLAQKVRRWWGEKRTEGIDERCLFQAWRTPRFRN